VQLLFEVSLPSHEQFAMSQSSFLQSWHLQAVHLLAVHLPVAQLPAVSQFLFESQHFFSWSQHLCSAVVCDSSAADITAMHGTITAATISETKNPFDIARSP
jgi:hypothetical protein